VKSTLTALAAVFAIALTPACATTQKTPAGRLAESGLKIAQAIGGFQTAVTAVGTNVSDQRVKQASIDALELVDKANVKGKEVAPILAPLTQSRTRQRQPGRSNTLVRFCRRYRRSSLSRVGA
jgi:hypothetical protein